MTIENVEYECIGDCRIGPEGYCLGCGRPANDATSDFPDAKQRDADAVTPAPAPASSDCARLRLTGRG